MTRSPDSTLLTDLLPLLEEIARQDIIHPSGFPATRDGIRLGLAAADDEVREALQAWREGRCQCSTPMCGHHDWSAAAGEMLQAAAVLMRAWRSITMPEQVASEMTGKAPMECQG